MNDSFANDAKIARRLGPATVAEPGDRNREHAASNAARIAVASKSSIVARMSANDLAIRCSIVRMS